LRIWYVRRQPRTTRSVFTNCGETRKLIRVPFAVSRLAEFCNRKELINQTGHDVWEWPMVVLKELLDNALDECEEAGIAPIIGVDVDGTRITITDNGRGFPADTIERVLDYNVRVSSREAYASPTRGAQGNALKTILPMGYILGGRGEDAAGETVVEANGVAHRIKFSVDHIRQEPKIDHTTASSPIGQGTWITVNLPDPQSHGYEDWIAERNQKFLNLAEAYTWLNPHLALTLRWNGKIAINATPSDPTWTKWSPSWPTSPHWYDESRFRRYMCCSYVIFQILANGLPPSCIETNPSAWRSSIPLTATSWYKCRPYEVSYPLDRSTSSRASHPFLERAIADGVMEGSGAAEMKSGSSSSSQPPGLTAAAILAIAWLG
jgi:hypothetical protein